MVLLDLFLVEDLLMKNSIILGTVVSGTTTGRDTKDRMSGTTIETQEDHLDTMESLFTEASEASEEEEATVLGEEALVGTSMGMVLGLGTSQLLNLSVRESETKLLRVSIHMHTSTMRLNARGLRDKRSSSRESADPDKASLRE